MIVSVAGLHMAGVVHRLDKCVGGVMVFAKSDVSHLRLVAQFYRSQVHKTYLCLCHASSDLQDVGRVDNELKDWADRSHSSVYKMLRRFGSHYAAVSVQTQSGRFHQVREDMSKIGCPIVLDKRYGFNASPSIRSLASHSNICLQATKLRFRHPTVTHLPHDEPPLAAHSSDEGDGGQAKIGKLMCIESEQLPTWWQAIEKKLASEFGTQSAVDDASVSR